MNQLLVIRKAKKTKKHKANLISKLVTHCVTNLARQTNSQLCTMLPSPISGV
jgi:predicted DNA-binding ribbon-helix-helix protein